MHSSFSIPACLDRLIAGGASFALYRLPWRRESRLVLHSRGEVQRFSDILELNGRRGFVMAPFNPSAGTPIALIVPEYQAEGDGAIARLLEKVDSGNSSRPPSSSLPAGGRSGNLDFEGYEAVFQRFMEPLREGLCRKLVLSRALRRSLPPRFSPFETFREACRRYPGGMVSLVHTDVTGTWLGCTPEVLLRGEAEKWESVALAGTIPIGEAGAGGLGWSMKNRREQAVVADYVRGILQRFSKSIRENSPRTVRAGHLAHLRSDFSFDLEDRGRLGELLDSLHPTPAVCGFPKAFARDFILSHEGFDRRYFTGFLGWLDPGGMSGLYVNLRCMELTGEGATLYAGGGLLPTSTADSEWRETAEKINTINTLF